MSRTLAASLPTPGSINDETRRIDPSVADRARVEARKAAAEALAAALALSFGQEAEGKKGTPARGSSS
jgi:hypothetical protein